MTDASGKGHFVCIYALSLRLLKQHLEHGWEAVTSIWKTIRYFFQIHWLIFEEWRWQFIFILWNWCFEAFYWWNNWICLWTIDSTQSQSPKAEEAVCFQNDVEKRFRANSAVSSSRIDGQMCACGTSWWTSQLVVRAPTFTRSWRTPVF